MGLKADQERLKCLLKDTITLLCRNGLAFNNEFSIEAVIGITLDKDDVFLVSINEQIHSKKGSPGAGSITDKNDMHTPDTEMFTCPSPNGKIMEASPKRRRVHIKKDSDQLSETEISDNSLRSHESEAKKPKHEPNYAFVDKHSSDQNEETFIKQEFDADLATEEVSDRDLDTAVRNMPDVNTVPIRAKMNDSVWEQTTTLNSTETFTSQGHNVQGLMPAGTELQEQTNEVLRQQIDPALVRYNQLTARGSIPQRTNLQRKAFRCHICGKAFSQAHCVRRHVMSIHEKVRHFCPLCPYSNSRLDALRSHLRVMHGSHNKDTS